MNATSPDEKRTGGTAVPTITKVRAIGSVVLGLGLAVGCGAVLVHILPWLSNPGKMADGTTFTSAQQGYLIAALLAWGVLLAPVHVVGGVQLFRYGRLSRRFGIAAAIMGGITFVGIWYVAARL